MDILGAVAEGASLSFTGTVIEGSEALTSYSTASSTSMIIFAPVFETSAFGNVTVPIADCLIPVNLIIVSVRVAPVPPTSG